MTLKDLLFKANYSVIYRYLKKYSPYTNGIEYDMLPHKKQIKIKNAVKRRYFKFYNELKNTKEIKDEDRFIVIPKLFDEIDGYKNGFDYSPFFVEKSCILEKSKNGDITLWNGDEETRVEHYAFDGLEVEEILGYSICPNTLQLNYSLIVAIMMIEISRFGFTKQQREAKFNSIKSSLEEALEDIKSGRTYTLEEMELEFDQLREKISGKKETEEEKRIRKEESEKRRERSRKITDENHLIVIEDVKSIIM